MRAVAPGPLPCPARLPAGGGSAGLGAVFLELPAGELPRGGRAGQGGAARPHAESPTAHSPGAASHCSHLARAPSCSIFPNQLSFGVDPGSGSGCGVACCGCWGSFASAGHCAAAVSGGHRHTTCRRDCLESNLTLQLNCLHWNFPC